jgi:hypothetical protein
MDNTDLIDQPDHLNAPDRPDEDLECEVEEDTIDNSQNKLPVEEEYPDGLQYEDEESPDHYDYDKYQGPLEEDEPVYIQAMHEDEHSAKAVPPQFDNIDWESCRDSIKTCYQHTPWMPCNIWEFTPCDGMTHIRSCKICTRYKEHHVEAEILGDKQESCAWKNCNSYEWDLIHLEWTLAHKGESAIPPPEANLMTLSAFNDALQCHSHQLTTQLEAVCQLNKELTKELECEHLNVSLRASEADFWQDQLQHLQKKYRELEDRLLESQPRVQPSKNIDIMSEDSHPVEIPT